MQKKSFKSELRIKTEKFKFSKILKACLSLSVAQSAGLFSPTNHTGLVLSPPTLRNSVLSPPTLRNSSRPLHNRLSTHSQASLPHCLLPNFSNQSKPSILHSNQSQPLQPPRDGGGPGLDLVSLLIRLLKVTDDVSFLSGALHDNRRDGVCLCVHIKSLILTLILQF